MRGVSLRRWSISGSSRTTLIGKDVARRIVLAQSAICLLLFVTLWANSWVLAYSGVIGGGIATITNALFARKVFIRYRAQNPAELISSIYSAEIQKIFITAVLFASVIIWFDVLSYGALFGSYFVLQIVPMFVFHFKVI